MTFLSCQILALTFKIHYVDVCNNWLGFYYYYFYYFSFIYISWRLITLQYCSGFCHTLI